MRIVLASLLFLSCGVVDLPIAEVPDGGDFRRPQGPPCTDASECRPGDLCRRERCGAALGHCGPRPQFCPGNFAPVCGCDGVTYWNPCLLAAAGIEAVEEVGPCVTFPLRCSDRSACPNGDFCAQLRRPQDCGRGAEGQCYSLPSSCEAGPDQHYFACGGGTQCLEACAAIRAELPMSMVPGPCP